MSTTGNAGEQYFENLFNPNTGEDALAQIEDFTDFLDSFDTVTTGQVLLKQSSDPRELAGIAKATASTASTLVERGSDGSVTADKIIIDDTSHAVTIDTATLSQARTLTIPDETGTVVTSVNTDFVANNTQRTNINALTNDQFIQKTGTNTFSSKAATSTYSASDSNLVERSSGKIKSATINLGADGGSSELNIKTSTGASASLIGSDNPTVNLIRNGAGSDNFGGDVSSDWRLRNNGGNLQIDRGNSGLTNGFITPLRLAFTNAIEINRNLGGAVVDNCPLRHYRQVAGNLNNYYVDVLPDSSVTSNYQQKLPAASGTYALQSDIAWNVSSGNITTKGANDNVGIGSPGSFPSRITFAGGIESKICLFDGGLGNMYGFGISSNQLNYHVNTTSDKHVFYVGGTNGDGTQLLEIAGNKNTTLNGSLIIQDTVAGTAKITLQDATDHDDIDILFQGHNGSTLIDNAVIRTENNYLNLETSNTSPMNGIRLSTNSTLGMTIDNNQNAIFENQVGIGKNPATGFTLDVDGTLPSVFRGTVNYLGQATYNPDGGSFPPTYFMGLRLASGVFTNEINTLSLSSDKTINFPDTTGTVAVKNASGQLQVDELVGTLGGSTKIDLTPGGGNIDLVVPNSAGGLSPNVDINFKTDTKVRLNLNSIDGIVFHENFIFKNTAGSTYFPLSFNGSVANSLNVGTAKLNLPSAELSMGTGDLTMTSGDLTMTNGDLTLTSGALDVEGAVEIGSGNLHMTSGSCFIGNIPSSVPIGVQVFHLAHGVTTAGVEGEFGVAKIGNGIADYAMFSHSNNFTTGNYALLQQNDGETFLNCATAKQIHFRVNNATRGGIDDESGKVRTFFIVPSATKPVYSTSGKIAGDYNSLDNITFRQFTTGGTQNERTHMYSQIVVDSSTTPFTQVALPMQDYGSGTSGFTSPNPGFAFRVCDATRHAQVYCQFSGFTTASNGLQTVKLQMFAKKADGTNAYVDICTFDFYVNLRFNHESFSFSKLVQFTHSFYSHARFVLVSGTFTGDTGDFFHLSIDSLPRLTR